MFDKQWLILGPAMILLQAGAQAQSQSTVTMYGVLDAAVAVEDTGDPNSSSRKAINSGNQSSSRLGFRGTEDLGGGLKAFFNLEAGIGLDTGTAESAFFGRRSVVGIESTLGTLVLGREYSPLAGVAAASDIFGQGFFGTNLSAFSSGRLTRRVSNSVSYKTPSFAGLAASFMASPSEGVAGASKLTGTALEYRSGRLFAAGGYHGVSRPGGPDGKEYGMGFGYGLDNMEFKVNYLVADPGTAGRKFQQMNIGASIAFGKGQLLGNVQTNSLEGGAKGTALAATYAYELSRRSNLYASYARMSNNASAAFALNSSSTSVAPATASLGADPSVIALGIRHRF
ncbi:MAG: porin [Rubrivivax sp.]